MNEKTASGVTLLMFLIVLAVVIAITYDFAEHNTRYKIFTECSAHGVADIRFSMLECTPLHPNDAPRVLDKLREGKENAPPKRGAGSALYWATRNPFACSASG